MTFSDSGLVWVGKADEESTIGVLKEAHGLDIQYSAELTQAQIEEIKAQTVENGDWALISLRPFTSEETLTVTMVNGDQFTVKVTDAQISTHVITADGEDFLITVTYGPEAKIPEGATLSARELLEGTEEYEAYIALAQAALNADDSGSVTDPEEDAAANEDDANEGAANEGASEDAAAQSDAAAESGAANAAGGDDFGDLKVTTARFFDITILDAEGNAVEPAAPVAVTIEYAEAAAESENYHVLHFGEESEVLDSVVSG